MPTLRGTLLMLVLCVSAFAQDPVAAFPQNYRVLLDNDRVHVLRAHYGPHEAIGVHDHSDRPTIYVYLNDSGPVRFVHEPENLVLDHAPTQTGGFRVSPGRMERHRALNLSGKPSEYVRVELKGIPIGTLKPEFRAPPPQAPLVPGTAVVYDTAQLRIERVICAAEKMCELPSAGAPSVLVAFTPLRLRNRGKTSSLTDASPVAWLPNGEAATARSENKEPVHMLRIYLPVH